MTIDYESHPSQLVEGGKTPKNVGIDSLKAAIPKECFKANWRDALFYLSRDILMASSLMYAAYRYVPLIENPYLRWGAWGLYGWLEGLVFTGLWVIGHECGHGAYTPSKRLNDIVGYLLHTSLMTPFFSWKSSHRRHHIYANNMELDHNYVPPRKDDYVSFIYHHAHNIEEVTEDSPAFTLFRIIVQQLFGFPWYLMFNITASPKSLPKPPSKSFLGNSHFAPWGSLFRGEEAHLILISDIGLASMAALLYYSGTQLGSNMMMLLYLQPYLWVNHWIVAITYLHHTHPKLPKFEPEAWTFIRGATATVDREFGFIGKHFFHGIIEFHVIHHLFSRIPFYHAEEATNAIIPLLGDMYHSDKKRTFLGGIWESFIECQWVEPDETSNPKDRALWYKGGPSPPPEMHMGKRRWAIQFS